MKTDRGSRNTAESMPDDSNCAHWPRHFSSIRDCGWMQRSPELFSPSASPPPPMSGSALAILPSEDLHCLPGSYRSKTWSIFPLPSFFHSHLCMMKLQIYPPPLVLSPPQRITNFHPSVFLCVHIIIKEVYVVFFPCRSTYRTFWLLSFKNFTP